MITMTLQILNISEFDWNPIIAGAIGILIGAVSTYFSKRAEFRVLKENNASLQKENEAIRASYELEISKRKYRYEEKLRQYSNFFSLIDSCSKEMNSRTQQQCMDAINRFYSQFLIAVNANDSVAESNAASNFQRELTQIMMDANEYLIKFRQQTNTIKLIASNEIIGLLELFDSKMEESMKLSTTCLQDIQSLILLRNVQQLDINQNQINIIGQEIILIKDKIISLMRKELNQI